MQVTPLLKTTGHLTSPGCRRQLASISSQKRTARDAFGSCSFSNHTSGTFFVASLHPRLYHQGGLSRAAIITMLINIEENLRHSPRRLERGLRFQYALSPRHTRDPRSRPSRVAGKGRRTISKKTLSCNGDPSVRS